jgi:hypothetical protein
MSSMARRLLAVLALGTVVQCSDEATGITGSADLMVGRMAGIPYEGDASATLVRQMAPAAAAPDTLFIFAARPRNAGFNVDEAVIVRVALDGALAPGRREVAVEVIHLLGGDVRVGGYNGTGTLEITAFSGVDSLVHGRLEFTAADASANRPGRYGASVAFTDGVFRARLRLSQRGL